MPCSTWWLRTLFLSSSGSTRAQQRWRPKRQVFVEYLYINVYFKWWQCTATHQQQNVSFQVVAIPHYDHDRVCTTLKQIVRDWSSEGADERAECYTPIVNELITLFPHVKTKMHDQEGAGAASSSSTATEKTRVLVPGAGLARLAFEIAKLGFECQGCEFSYHMLIASHFILNKCPVANGFTIHPYVNAWCNNMSSGDQSRAITFPDESPMQFLNETDSFSMCAGDFLDIYNTSSGGEDEARWDCVITCYFVDTAHNVVDYVEKIWQLLKPNGLWINYGPLLYHFSEQPGEASIELSYEQLRVVIDRVGFEILVRLDLAFKCNFSRHF